jgi:hypothetical protein
MTTDLQSIETAFSTMLREVLEEAFSRRDVEADLERVLVWVVEKLERVRSWVVEHLERVLTWVVEHRDELMAGFLSGLQRAQEAIQAIDSMPPAPGYEPLLIERGQHWLSARVLAYALVSLCEGVAIDERTRGQVVTDIRFLAKPGRTRGAIRRRAIKLLAALDRISSLDAIGEVGPIVVQFDEDLKAAVQGDPAACERVTQTAAILAPRLSVPRGRKRSPASVAHEILSSEMPHLFGPRRYTWDPVRGDFTDRFTRATRETFKDPDFDPRPALRRAKKAQRTAPGRRIA